MRHPVSAGIWIFLAALPALAADFSKGDLVRLTRRETLQFNGKNLVTVPKGGEFVVLKQESGKLFVEYYKDDDTLIAATFSAESAAAVPCEAYSDVVRAAEAFRDRRSDEARRLLLRASEDVRQKPLAMALAARINGNPQSIRDTAEQLAKAGHSSLALALDQGADKLGGASVSRINRDEIGKRAATATRAIARGRQAIALRKLFAATKIIEEGLAAEPARPELKTFQARVQKDIANADDKYEAAERLRVHGLKGVVHALSSLDDGLRLCADHPKLLALKKEMLSAFEERTSPQVTPAFLAANKIAANDNLNIGRELYTTRCTECHDLEMLDSRSLDGWQKMVGSMSRRAGLSGTEQSRILDYLAAALRAVEAMPAE